MKKYTMAVRSNMAAARSTLKVSTKDSIAISRKINRKPYKFARKFMEDLIAGKKSINGKYKTAAAKEILTLMKSAESNAKQKGLNADEMMLRISAHQGPRMMRGRRKRRFGLMLKMTHVHAVLEESRKPKKIGKKGEKK